MTLTLLKCCNMLESSEQSIVSPLLGLKSQDLHQLCIAIVPQDFTWPSPLVNREDPRKRFISTPELFSVCYASHRLFVTPLPGSDHVLTINNSHNFICCPPQFCVHCSQQKYFKINYLECTTSH